MILDLAPFFFFFKTEIHGEIYSMPTNVPQFPQSELTQEVLLGPVLPEFSQV